MIVLFSDSDGNVVGSIQGYGQVSPDLQMKVGEEVLTKTVITKGHPQEELAFRLVSPKDKLKIRDVKIVGEEVQEKTDAEKAKEPKVRGKKDDSPTRPIE